jgi:hypothetical protein
MTESISTSLATVTHSAPDRLEVRCHEGVYWSERSIAELIQARATLAAGAPMKVLVVLPEDIHFDTLTLAAMHYDPATMKEHCRAEAWAVRNTLNEKIAQLYFRYFPSPVPSAFFMTEEEASVWLDQL